MLWSQVDLERAVQEGLAAGITVSAATGACPQLQQRTDRAPAAALNSCAEESADGVPACGTVAGEPVVLCIGLQQEQGRLTVGGHAHYFSEDGRDLGLAGRLVRTSEQLPAYTIDQIYEIRRIPNHRDEPDPTPDLTVTLMLTLTLTLASMSIVHQ